jgi:actin-like ATPase involved in cell morphogenesis
MASAFGIDFGTSNSLVAHVRDGRVVRSFVDRNQNNMPHPSVVWYRAADVSVGFEARGELDGGSEAIAGDFVRSPKRLLGQEDAITLPGRKLSCWDPAAQVLAYLKAHAMAENKSEVLERAVFTVPISFDGQARHDLRQAALEAGIKITYFVHEPLAALYAHLRAAEDWRRRLAELNGAHVLVFDWGGGTLDLTLCQITGLTLRQVANRGNSAVGGDRFDESLRSYIRQKHADQFGLSDVRSLERPNMAVKLLRSCENAKIDLSSKIEHALLIRNYLDQPLPARDLKVTISRNESENILGSLVEEGIAEIERLLEEAGISKESVEFCLPIGGTVNMPAIYSRIEQYFRGRVQRTDNPERLIAEGAAWIANDGAHPATAKSLEIEDASGSFATILEAGRRMPFEGESVPIANSHFYCADPRDGIAVFRFVRPRRFGKHARSEQRVAYANTIVEVDPFQRPLVERITLTGEIDDDYVLALRIESTGRRHVTQVQIADIEFALRVGGDVPGETTPDDDQGSSKKTESISWQRSARIRRRPFLRSNITEHQSAIYMVPGDIVRNYWPNALDTRRTSDQNARQIAEALYYQVCATCARTTYELTAEGCADCARRRNPDLAPEAASARRARAVALMKKAIDEETGQGPNLTLGNYRCADLDDGSTIPV